MALLEYYAIDADLPNKEIARTNYRVLAISSFKIYVYTKCGGVSKSMLTLNEAIIDVKKG
ncbi:hypothetical protein V5I80_15535 [Acinetobacter radioresistens]|uniref:hypothetical protein n=1 Tax=Acinetobacter radioresistens TaxID=40216 RepID=UPI002FCD9094